MKSFIAVLLSLASEVSAHSCACEFDKAGDYSTLHCPKHFEDHCRPCDGNHPFKGNACRGGGYACDNQETGLPYACYSQNSVGESSSAEEPQKEDEAKEFMWDEDTDKMIYKSLGEVSTQSCSCEFDQAGDYSTLHCPKHFEDQCRPCDGNHPFKGNACRGGGYACDNQETGLPYACYSQNSVGESSSQEEPHKEDEAKEFMWDEDTDKMTHKSLGEVSTQSCSCEFDQAGDYSTLHCPKHFEDHCRPCDGNHPFKGNACRGGGYACDNQETGLPYACYLQNSVGESSSAEAPHNEDEAKEFMWDENTDKMIYKSLDEAFTV